MAMQARGVHSFGTFYGITPALLSDAACLEQWCKEACLATGATVLDSMAHQFDPGATALVLLSESHLSIHTWPETGTAFLDCFTCGNLRPSNAIEYMEHKLKPASVNITTLERT